MLRGSLKTRFVAAIRQMLRPVVRQLIANGVSYSAFNRIVKELYVEVAEDDFALAFKRQTDSRLSLVTGINRKEVSSLRRRVAWRAPLPEVEDTLATHVIGRWMAGPPFATDDGTPLLLAYETKDPDEASFARLVRDLGADVPVRSVLDELLRIGAVELRPDGRVLLRQEVHVPAGDVEGKFTLLGSEPAELFETIMHNIQHDDTPRLQRKVVYDNVGAAALPELRTRVRRVGEAFVRQANALLASYDRDRNPAAPGGPRSRVVLATYYFEEELAPDASPTDPAPPPGRIKRSS